MKGQKFVDGEDVICMANGGWKRKTGNSTTESELWRNAGVDQVLFSCKRLS